ncbi:glycoside hydrolase family 95-like protein [Streptomyces prunicolor]|uniref:glycoside hydrolase family 95-like protein n=1 Tax=Streptomyces prunicolor TaxID=67348 RepID=UPI0037190C20
MLLGSRPGTVELLPARPPEWRSGSLRGLATRAGVGVDELTWDVSEGLAKVVLTSPLERDIVLACRDGSDQRQTVHLLPHVPTTVTVPLA